MITVGEISRKINFTIDYNCTIRDAIDLMKTNSKGMVIITDKSKIVGILTERDLISLINKQINFSEKLNIFVTNKIITVNSYKSLNHSLTIMVNHNIRRLVVVDNNNDFVGIVTQDMILSYLEEDIYKINLKVKEIPTIKEKNIVFLNVKDTIKDSIKMMQIKNIGSILIKESEKIVGIITERDVVKILWEKISLDTELKYVMSSPLIFVYMEDEVNCVTKLMESKNIRRVVVLSKEEKVVSILGIRDIIKFIKNNYNNILEKKLEYTKEVFNFIGEAVIELLIENNNFMIEWINKSAEEAFSRDIIGKDVTFLLDIQDWLDIKKELFNKASIKDYKIKIQERFFYLTCSYYCIKNDNTLILVLKDITSLENELKEETNKRKEKEKYLMHQSRFALMGEMINNIAHQWRQPLANINSVIAGIDVHFETRTLTRDILDEKLDQIESQTRYMSQTIEDFRKFFHPNKEKSTFFVSEALNDALSITRLSLEAKNITYSINIKKDMTILGFSKEYTQAIIIIINNAIDTLINNSVVDPKLEIVVSSVDSKSYISIKDNACGVPTQIEDKIFDPYFTTKHQTQGTGLGLYMCKMIIENSLEGKLCLKNSPTGAKFIIIV